MSRSVYLAGPVGHAGICLLGRAACCEDDVEGVEDSRECGGVMASALTSIAEEVR